MKGWLHTKLEALHPNAAQRHQQVGSTVHYSVMDDACLAEVIRLHDFFVKWLNGSIVKDDIVFEKECDCALARNVILIQPNGNLVGYHDLKRDLLEAHGSKTCFDIKVMHMEVVQPLLLVYEEWHYHEKVRTDARQCTAFFRPNPKAPCGVEWIHVHETSIQGKCGTE